MKKIMLILVLLQIIAFSVKADPVVKKEKCGKVSTEQFITALSKNDPDGILSGSPETIKADYKKVFNWAIVHYGWGYDPIVSDDDLYAAMRVCSNKTVTFSKGDRLISHMENGVMKYDAFRGNYIDEEAGTFKDVPLWSAWCFNLLPENDFLTFIPKVGSVKKDVVLAAGTAGQPIIINNYVYAGNNNGNNNGGDATALALNQPKEDAVDASAPYVAPPPPPAPRYDPPVVYREEPKIIYTTSGSAPVSNDSPECKKASPWGYILAAGAGVAAGYLLNAVLGNKSSSSGTIYGPPSGYPVDVNGGNPTGPGGPVEVPGGYPVDITGG